jgi:hypothetical protein
MAQNSDQWWVWFWIRNVGLLLPIFVAITLLGGVPRRVRRLTLSLWLWFVVPNLVAFHPSEWNNTKFFLFWQFAGCLAVATWLTRAFAETHRVRVRVPRMTLQVMAVMGVLVMISAGGLDAIRAMQRSSSIAWVDADDVSAAAWLREHSDPDEIIVYGTSNTSAVAAMGGRRAISGYPGWTFDLGLLDWAERWTDSGTILRGVDGTDGTDGTVDAAIERYGVDLVVIGPRERTEQGADDEVWRSRGTLVAERGEYRIYRVR